MHPWCGGHFTSINACGVLEVRDRVQIFKRKLYTHICYYIRLYNPLSREEIWLPPLPLNSENSKFILSSKPTNPSCIVLVLHQKSWCFEDSEIRSGHFWRMLRIGYHMLQRWIPCTANEGKPPYPEVPYLLQVKFSPKCHVKSIPTKANGSFILHLII